MDKPMTSGRANRHLKVLKKNARARLGRRSKSFLNISKRQFTPSEKPGIFLSHDYSCPSLWREIVGVWDLRGSFDEYTLADIDEMRVRWLSRPSEEEVAANELKDCWRAVGQHIWDAIGAHRAIENPQDMILSDGTSEQTK